MTKGKEPKGNTKTQEISSSSKNNGAGFESGRKPSKAFFAALEAVEKMGKRKRED